VVCVLAAACSRAPEGARALGEGTPEDAADLQAYFRQRVLADQQRGMAIELVKRSPFPETGQAVEAWLATIEQDAGGTILFPSWNAIRISPQKLLVTFQFTQVLEDVGIFRKGYRWEVDALLELVGPPEALEPEPITQDGRSQPDSEPKPARRPVDLNLE